MQKIEMIRDAEPNMELCAEFMVHMIQSMIKRFLITLRRRVVSYCLNNRKVVNK